ncbi:hypothetical protein [Micromonospora echinaurantiaca]|uniref:hypothetical protein n=1 Tax=Micromonospora echinaurantiaca TaxID=47857 RepID=UPI00378C914D
MVKANPTVLALIIGAFFIPLSLTGCTESKESAGETRIFEIDNTEEVFGRADEQEVTVKKHYMILNPPEDLAKLKELAEKYGKDHRIEEEVQGTGTKSRVFYMYFYRESDDLPRDWQPDEGYLNTDRLEHHKNDLIASITWSDVDPQKKYHSYEKSKEGKILKRMYFIEDRLVQ